MGVIPERKEYKNFTYERYLTLSEQATNLGFKKVTHTPHSEKSHFDKTGLLYDNKKVVLVYDVKANMLTVTAQEKAIKKLSTLIGDNKKQEKVAKLTKEKPQQNENKDKQKKNLFAELFSKKDKKGEKVKEKPQEDPKKVRKEEKQKEKKQEKLQEKTKKEKQQQKPVQKQEKQKKENKQNQKDQSKAKDKRSKQELKQETKFSKQEIKLEKQQQERIAKEEKIVVPKAEPQKGRSGTYSVISDYYPLSFAKAMHKIRNDDEVKINTLRSSYSKNNSDNRYVVILGDKQCEINYMQESGTLDISGEATPGIKEVFLSFGGREIYASVSGEVQLDDYVVILKNKMPSALNYLSAQEKNDLASGMRELEKAVDHYEYSMFLLSPFKGLENFIFDLLKSKNITVKMIGQAYEKSQNGAYVLKESYQNRCGVVYSEVMAALYEEYFATRNFYAHADVNGSHNIGSKKDAIAVVNKIYKTIEYNCKKLTEINFKLVR